MQLHGTMIVIFLFGSVSVAMVFTTNRATALKFSSCSIDDHSYSSPTDTLRGSAQARPKQALHEASLGTVFKLPYNLVKAVSLSENFQTCFSPIP